MEIYANDSDSQHPSPVSKEKAIEHANYAVKVFWIFGARGLNAWKKVQLEDSPLAIFDLNGQLLFYEYLIIDGKRPVGLAKVSASKIIGSAVPQIQVTPRRWDPETAIKKTKKLARNYINKHIYNAKIVGAEFICYSYPKIGVSIKIDDPSSGERNLIFDASSLSRVDNLESHSRDGFAWSFYETIALPNAKKNEVRWEAIDAEMESLINIFSQKYRRTDLLKDFTRAYLELIQNEAMYAKKFGQIALEEKLEYKNLTARKYSVPSTPFTEKIIQFSPHHKTHDCYNLNAEENDTYCAVATGQMILDFYRYYYDQKDIASAMNYSLANGCTLDDQKAGYNDLSNNGLAANIDKNPTWKKAAGEIDANCPFKSGIGEAGSGTHARACFGYRKADIWPAGQQQPLWLFILDPYPPHTNSSDGGAVLWEDWYSLPHTDFIYLHHS